MKRIICASPPHPDPGLQASTRYFPQFSLGIVLRRGVIDVTDDDSLLIELRGLQVKGRLSGTDMRYARAALLARELNKESPCPE